MGGLVRSFGLADEVQEALRRRSLSPAAPTTSVRPTPEQDDFQRSWPEGTPESPPSVEQLLPQPAGTERLARSVQAAVRATKSLGRTEQTPLPTELQEDFQPPYLPDGTPAESPLELEQLQFQAGRRRLGAYSSRAWTSPSESSDRSSVRLPAVSPTTEPLSSVRLPAEVSPTTEPLSSVRPPAVSSTTGGAGSSTGRNEPRALVTDAPLLSPLDLWALCFPGHVIPPQVREFL